MIGIVVGAIRPALTLVALACAIPALAHDLSPSAATGGVTRDEPDMSVSSTPLTASPGAGQVRRANFLGEIASEDARRVANWAVASGDNDGLPFIIIDKVRAKVFVFDDNGRLRGASLALLGMARGDESVPGIGARKLAAIRPEERTTPAGRFVAALGRDLKQDILWIDYDASISLHRVITGNPGDHRLERLATTSSIDKRISYGCVNVPVTFYEDVVIKTLTGGKGIVYILPEIKTLEEVFPLAQRAG
jgi:hypothetical protein